MLSLEPPYQVLEGHAILPDHEDPGLRYAMPVGPRLAEREGEPAFDLTLYADSGAGAQRTTGGILTLTTELVVPDDVLGSLAARLSDPAGGGPSVRVAPVSFDSGTVELAVLGRTSVAPPSGSAAPGGPFEVTFVAGGRPSLTAANDAAFQLLLDEQAAEAVAASLEQASEPVLVTYAMTYAALRPAFTVDVEADWSRVYSELTNRLTTNAWFVAADVDTSVRHALETSGIHVDTVVEGTAEGDRAAAERTAAQLVDWVMDRLFESMVPPAGTADTIGRVVDDTIWSLQRAIVPGASYRLRSLDETQLRRMRIRSRERVAEQREVRLQGTLDALLRRLRFAPDGTPALTWPAVRDRLVHTIELAGFPRLEVAVGVVDRFATDGLRSVDVELARATDDGSDPDPSGVTVLSFTPGAASRSWVVNLLDETARAAALQRPYVYRVVARFDPSSPVRPGDVATSSWSGRASADLVVDPREAYAVTDVTVATAPLFSFDLFPAVVVDVVPGGVPTSHAELAAVRRVQLDAAAPVQHWVFSSPPGDVSYSYRPTYHRPVEAGGQVVGPWATAVEPFLSLPDPMPEKLTVTFFVDLPWPTISLALLQIRYLDAANGIRYAPETVTLDATTAHVTRTYSVATNGSRSIDYRLTIQRVGGGLVDGSWRTADDDRVVVDRRLVEERAVAIRVLGTLADRALARASLTVEARDPATGVPRSSAVVPLGATAPPATPVPPFTYLLGDPPLLEVWWQLSTVDSNGFPAVQPWAHGPSDLLVVDLRSLTVTG